MKDADSHRRPLAFKRARTSRGQLRNKSVGAKAAEISPVDVELLLLMERVWLLMAVISMAVSEHRTIKRHRPKRRLADRARKALFDLYLTLERDLVRCGYRNAT
jgi:hypothetical protein